MDFVVYVPINYYSWLTHIYHHKSLFRVNDEQNI